MADFDIVIIGAGAAGLAAAIFAGEEARRMNAAPKVALFDGAKKPGAKILVSGGGRCNVTNEKVTEADYCGGSSKIIRNVLRAFNEQKTLEWMDQLGVPLKLEPTGKYFPRSDSARTVLDALMQRVDEIGVMKQFGFRVGQINRIAVHPGGALNEAHWQITNAANNATVTARALVIATGGRALPKSGSDGAAYPWLTQLGHRIITPVPALAPLVLDERGMEGSPLSTAFAELSGVTIDARLEFWAEGRRRADFTGSLLFTHFGLSGPAAMNLSRHIARHRQGHPKNDPGHLRLALPVFPEVGPADQWLQEQTRQHPRAAVGTVLKYVMPERLAIVLASAIKVDRLTDMTRENRLHLARLLAGSPLAVKGDRGYSFAEATAGGIALEEVNWRTMESRKADGLFLCGEVLDVDGRIGGFNFQWAWASGCLAGRGAVRNILAKG